MVNKTLETYLNCFINGQTKQWMNSLHWVDYSYNTAPHSSTKISPLEALYGQNPPHLRKVGPSETIVGSLEEMLQEMDAIRDDLKFQLLRAQLMKQNEDRKKRDITFTIGGVVFLKLQPYRQKSIVKLYNENLAPRYYGPYMIKKIIGKKTYELDHPPHSQIHPVFHASQIKKAITQNEALVLPTQIFAQLELVFRPKVVLGSLHSKEGTLEVLLEWEDLRATEDMREDTEMIYLHFPHFHLEDNVRL